VQSACLPDVKAIREHIWKEISFDANAKTPNEVVVVMSNGSFDGLNEMLQRDLEGHSGGAHVALKD
jgi:hypothetical protein